MKEGKPQQYNTHHWGICAVIINEPPLLLLLMLFFCCCCLFFSFSFLLLGLNNKIDKILEALAKYKLHTDYTVKDLGSYLYKLAYCSLFPAHK